jgi:His-Xaa-Ser system protein HxsD
LSLILINIIVNDRRTLRYSFIVVVEFGAGVQSLGALQAAAYRLIGTATCQIDQVADGFVCQLSPVNSPNKKALSDLEALRIHFLDLVTDENLRERIAARTEGVRNVILSLAFGSLANSPKNGP